MKKLLLMLCIMLFTFVANTQTNEQPVKTVVALGFQHALGFNSSVFYNKPLQINGILAIPQFSFRAGLQFFRASIDIGAENTVGFEVGRYVHLGIQGGYSIVNVSWLCRAHIGGRIPLDARHRHHFIVEHGIQLNGLSSSTINPTAIQVWVVSLRLGLQFGLTNK